MRLADLLFSPEREPDPAEPLVHGPGDAVASWADVRRRAGDVAGALRGAGVEPGHAVGVMLPNGADVVAALFGVWQAGAVYVPLNPRLTPDEVTHTLEAVGSAAQVTADEPGETVAETAGIEQFSPQFRLRSTDIGSARRRYDGDVALVQFTSGTTGRPKPVLLTHSGVLTLLDNVLAKLRSGGGQSGSSSSSPAKVGSGVQTSQAPQPTAAGTKAPMPNLVPVSLSLWAGIYNVLFAMRVGAPVVVMDGFEPLELVRLVQRHGIRSTVLPPAAMVTLVDDERVTDLAPLRFVRSITAPLSPLQARRFKERFGIAVLNSYGQTEIGGEIVGWNAADSREHGNTKLGSVGRPHAGVELRVDVGPGEAGELWVRTPAMSAGYADGASLGDRLTPDGWFRTGDVARIDGDGFLWIEGRLSDMINRGGLKVYPAEVEEVLRTSPQVADAAVVALPDARLGEVPYAFVVPTPGATPPPTADHLAALCRDHLAPYKIPVAFELLAALPRNAVGKILRTDLAIAAGSSSRVQPAGPRG